MREWGFEECAGWGRARARWRFQAARRRAGSPTLCGGVPAEPRAPPAKAPLVTIANPSKPPPRLQLHLPARRSCRPPAPLQVRAEGGGGGPGSGAVAVRHAFQPPPCPQTCGPQTLPTLVPTPITPTPTLPIPPPPPTTRALPALCALQPRQKPAHVPRHDEFERFLPAAFPYYASAAAAMVAWYGAGLAALYSA